MLAKEFDILYAASCIFYHTPHIGRFVQLPSVLYLQEPNRPLYEALPELPWVARDWTGKDLLSLRFWRSELSRQLLLPRLGVVAREERKNALAYDQILVNSFFSRESVLRAFGINSRVCYLGVDVDRFINQNKKRESFVVSLGAIIASKDAEFLVDAMGMVSAAIRPKLALVANTIDPGYFDVVRARAERAQVSLEVHHRISDEELVDVLNRARLMIYAPRLEPFGYAPLEANACGIPVIATTEGGTRETIQDGVNGLVVEHQPEDMAAAIERLLRDDELHHRLSAQAEKVVREKWSLPSSIDRLEERLKSQMFRRSDYASGRSASDCIRS